MPDRAAPTPLPVPPKAKRLAITISGAVSLGSYEAGVLYEVLDAIAQHNQSPETRKNPENRIVIDVLTGASAGGMTAIILAQKLLYDGASFRGPYNNPLYKAWVADIDIKGLQDTARDELALHSLFSSDRIERIAGDILLSRYRSSASPPQRTVYPAVDPDRPLQVGVSLSNLNGVDYGYRVQPQGLFEYREYADQLTRTVDPKDPQCDTLTFWTPLGHAAVATGAFPITFRPKDVYRSAEKEQGDFPPAKLVPWPENPRRFTYTDGGVFQNQPLGMAKNLVDLQDKHLSQESRYYLFVSPSAKDDGPISEFQASGADYRHMAERLLTAIMGQAGFRDWITAEDINDRVRLMDERAQGLKDALIGHAIPAGALQVTADSILDLFYPAGAARVNPGGTRAESRSDAETRIAHQYHQEMSALGVDSVAATAFRDSMLAFEVAAGLGARDLMKIYGVTAAPAQLAGAGIQAFLGFFDQRFRDHDYDVGRKHARHVLLNPVLAAPGEIGPILFNPAKHPLRPIDSKLDGATYAEVPGKIRRRFQSKLQQRVDQMIDELLPGAFFSLPLKWGARRVVSELLKRLLA